MNHASISYSFTRLGLIALCFGPLALSAVREAMVRVGDSGSCIQLLAPLNESSTIAKFLDRSGPGLQRVGVTCQLEV